MAFKSVEQFNKDRYQNLFRLADDGMSADVVFLYQSKADMLVADVHYVKSANYSGYVHCTGNGCPACKKGIRVQTKLFIPVYDIDTGAIEFWDRNMNTKFVAQLEKDVFDRFPNPSEYVFKITRHGEYRDVETHYDIVAVGKNLRMPYDQILAKFGATMPDYYENIVKTVSVTELADMLSRGSEDAVNQEYIPVPRAGYQSSIPETFVNAADVVSASSDVPSNALDSDEGSSDDGDSDLADPIF